jgi:ferredoxin--NADP+ reductase
MPEPNVYLVAVIGAGPAGLFAARGLAAQGARVVILNRDIKPGGLAEYGVYPNKHTMKEGFRKQFRQILANENITYYGNVKVGEQADITLEDLRKLGFQAILITVGAQGTKSLGLPGEQLKGVHHAKNVVSTYNKLPPFSRRRTCNTRRCAIIGAGNVMLDIVYYLIHVVHAEEAIAIVRRGPAEVKFTKEAMKRVVSNLDLAAFEAEMTRILPHLQAIHQDPEVGRHKVLDALAKADPKYGETPFRFRFLSSPVAILGEKGWVSKLIVTDNILEIRDGQIKARSTGSQHILDVDRVVFAIGDKVDDTFGLPSNSGEFFKNPAPRYPIDGVSYEAFDPRDNAPIEDMFVGGWARKASNGLVGTARKDGINASRALWRYLQTVRPAMPNLEAIAMKMKDLNKPIVTKDDIKKLEMVEAEKAQKLGVEEFRFATNEEMLQAMGFLIVV